MNLINSSGLSIKLSHKISSRCKLGEGLFVKAGRSAWVDICSKKVFLSDGVLLKTFATKDKPSIIYDVCEHEIILGLDAGLSIYSTLTKEEVILQKVSNMHDIKEYRSNDGGYCGSHQFLSFMHRVSPELNTGFVYRLSDDSWELIDDQLHIPNSFIEIEPSKILISDSLTGQVWIYTLSKSGAPIDKTLWAQLEPGIAPDGGCLVNDFVLIALWDAAAIGVFNRQGHEIDRFLLPVLRPTNCKFDCTTSQLWITSASEGLSKVQMSLYPHSGDTLVYDLALRS